ncbi:MAG: peptidase MA family metallohydrolase [Deltaproteobacteria bacterium]|nr:peptidase MA family metallohydrolase [Deltaproteobacteria bacterium]
MTSRAVPAKGSSSAQAALAVFVILAAAAYAAYLYYGQGNPPLIPPLSRGGKGGLPGETVIVQGPELEYAAPAAPEGERAPSGESHGLLKEAGLAAAKKDYTRAVILLKKALMSEPDSVAIKSALARTLNNYAVSEADSGRFKEAAALLKEATGYWDAPFFFKNLAMIQIRQGDHEGARAAISAMDLSLEDRASFKDAHIRAGNESLKAGDRQAALEHLNGAYELDPSDSGLRDSMQKLRAEHTAEEGMEKKEGGHFLVKFSGGENVQAGHLIGLLLEEAYFKIGADLGFYPDDKVEAVLYSREQFRDVTGNHSWAGAIYDGRIKIPAGGVTEKSELLEKLIFHEYTHAVVHRLSGGKAPTWLNEGLAQYEEGKDPLAGNALLRTLALDNKLSLRALEGSFLGYNQEKAREAYIASLSATGWLIREFGVHQAKRMLDGLGQGMTVDAALASSVYMSYEDFEKSWLDYLRK